MCVPRGWKRSSHGAVWDLAALSRRPHLVSIHIQINLQQRKEYFLENKKSFHYTKILTKKKMSSKNWIPNVPMSIRNLIFTIFIKKKILFHRRVSKTALYKIHSTVCQYSLLCKYSTLTQENWCLGYPCLYEGCLE